MIKTKTTITKYTLDKKEVIIALMQYIIKKRRLSEDFAHQAVDMQPTLNEDLEISNVELTFTNHKF